MGVMQEAMQEYMVSPEMHKHRKPPAPKVPDIKFSVPPSQRGKLWTSLAKQYLKKAKEGAAKPLQGVWATLTSSKDGEGETLTIAAEDQPTMLDIMDEALA